MKGNTQIGSTVQTVADGLFTITGVPNGTYNLVVSKDGIIVTTLITVTDSNYATGTISLPAGKTNSVVEVTGINTPSVVVGGLDNQFTASPVEDDDKGVTSDDQTVVTGGGLVEIKLTAEAKDSTAPNANNITITATSGGNTVGMFIDLSVIKTVTPSAGSPSIIALVELPSLVEVLIPLDATIQGKSSYFVYRYHGSSVDIITTTANADGEKIELLDNNTTIKLTVKKFSTYAIAYTTSVISPSKGGGGSYANYHTITVKQNTDGIISPRTTSVAEYTNKTFTITPNTDYKIYDVLVDGVSVGAVKEYTFSRVTKEHTIEAIFTKDNQDTGLPYYMKGGTEVFIGFSSEIGGKMKYIAPEGAKVLFKETTKSFTDISGHWASSSINFVTERELFVGTAPNMFSPDASMSRAMFATVIGRLHEASLGEISESTKNPFTDIAYDNWYTKYVIWAQENGIVSGMGGVRFEPDRVITRQEMAVLANNYLSFARFNMPVTQQYIIFDDEVNIAEWANTAVQTMQKRGIMRGVSDNTFDPQGMCTRAQVAAVLQRLICEALK